MSTTKFRITIILVFLLFFAYSLSYAELREGKTTVILSTDLSLYNDVDDWFDCFQFIHALGGDAKAIIIDYKPGVTSSERKKVIKELRKLLYIMNRPDIDIIDGIKGRLRVNAEGQITSGEYRDGYRYILQTLRQAKGKVRLIAVGSLRNEAMAYITDPDLFLNKVEYIIFSGGRLGSDGSTNVRMGPIAAEIIINSAVPKVWIQNTGALKQYLTFEDEEILRKDKKNLVATFLMKKTRIWRTGRGLEFLKKTGQQYFQGRNMWSIPAFLFAAGNGQEMMKFVRGKMILKKRRNGKIVRNFRHRVLDFYRDKDGPDLMLVHANSRLLVDWLLKQIKSWSN